MLVQGGPFQNFDVNGMEARLVRLDRRRIYIAFAVVVLVHASSVVGFSFWTPPELPSPPGDMVITVDLAPAMAIAPSDANPGVSSTAAQPQNAPPEPTPEDEVVEQEPPPPEPPVEPVKEQEKEQEEVVQQEPTPTPETVQENVETPPPAETAQVVLAPKSVKPKPKPKPKPQPTAPKPSQAATPAATQRADVAGTGAKASPNELNKYTGRVRAAIERNKKSKPAAANGIGGIAHVSFVISKSGGVTGLRIVKSSGNAALDAAALASVTGADIPAIPEGLPATISIGQPIRFMQ
jgi:periplasmic protein TonB